MKQIRRVFLSLAVLLLSMPLRAQCTGCTNLSFGPAVPWYPSGDASDQFAAADFDQDGVLDVALPGPQGGFILYFGDGRGTFRSHAVVPSDGVPAQFVAAGDFDGNGFPDLVGSNFGTFAILLADGIGGFAPSTTGSNGRGRVLVADFDRDGRVDLLTAENCLLGEGDGTLSPPLPLAGGPYSMLIASGDFNGDAVLDVAVSNITEVHLLLGDGTGGFTPGTMFPAPPSFTEVRNGAAADLTGDGNLDLALAIDASGGGPSSVQVLVGDGTGQLSPGASLPLPYSFSSIVAADFDGSGAIDVLTTGGHLFAGIGGGALGPPVNYGYSAWGLAPGDFNRDGITDAAAAMQGVGILLGQVSGGLAAPIPRPYFYDVSGAGIADVTGDGVPDVVASVAAFALNNSISIFPGTGGAGIGPRVDYALPSPASAITVAELKEDGVSDVAASTGGQIALLLWDGANGFLPPTFLDTATGASGVAAGLFDADAHQDLISVGSGLDLRLGDGTGGFEDPVVVSDVLAHALLALDFNGDGKTDIAAFGGAIHLFLGHGDGTFDAEVLSQLPGFTDVYAAADFDGDGFLDLAFGGVGEIPVIFGDGGGGFSAPLLVPAGNLSGYINPAAGDVDGDGDADLLVAAREEDLAVVITGNGDGTFEIPSSWRVSRYPARPALGDLDLDGKLDLVTLGDYVSVLRNSQCEARRLGTPTDVSKCAAPSLPFPIQPAVGVYDDGGNVITCHTEAVSASIVPGTGTPGALLAGTTDVAYVAGVATYADLSIGPVGAGYVLEFSHPVLGVTRSRSFTVGEPPQAPQATNSGPFCQGQTLNLYATTVPGAVYRWTGPGGFSSTAQSPSIPAAGAGAAGVYSVIALVDGCASAATDTTVAMLPPTPGPAIRGALQICAGSRLLLHVDDGAFHHTWFHNGVPIEGATGPEYSAAEMSVGDTGEYTASSADATGCTTAVSDPVTVTLDFCHAEAHALSVDPQGNGILEPAETAVINPTWQNNDIVDLALSGVLGVFTGLAGGSYVIDEGTANYGVLAPGAQGDCLSNADCHVVTVSAPGARPALHWDAFLDETPGADPAHTWQLHVGASFADVPPAHPFYAAVETVLHHGVTNGCTPTDYCPASGVTRAQMAVLLLRARFGPQFVPPPASGMRFADVPADAFAAAWIEYLAQIGVTAGCGNGNYCPSTVVNRAQMAVFLLRTAFITPPNCTGLFGDVPCPDGFAVNYIEHLHTLGVTGGCNAVPLLYCPGNPNKRGQMAVFLTRTFGLTLYGP